MSTTTLDRPGRALTERAPAPLAYDRISRFRVQRDGIDLTVTRGVDRQWRDNQECAIGLGLGVIPPEARFSDNDRSASQFAKRERERWLAFLASIRSGRFTHALVWLFDRAFRTTDDAEEFLDACRAGNCLIVQTAGNAAVADPHNPNDVFQLKLAGLLAEYEVAKMSVRIRRRKDSDAANGRPNGGRRRFGFEQDGMTVNEDEAPIVRELAGRLLGGESLAALAKSLNERGIPTVGQGEAWARGEYVRVYAWHSPTIRTMLLNPAYAGRRIHRGEDIGDAAWPALLDEETHNALVHKLTANERTSKSTARVYLLSGLGHCASCGLPLRARPTDKGPYYSCASDRHVWLPVERVDKIVRDYVVGKLGGDGSSALVDAGDNDRLAELKARRAQRSRDLDELDAERDAGDITGRTYGRRAEKIETDLDELDKLIGEASAHAARPAATLDGMTYDNADDALAAWQGAELGRRRALVELLIQRVALRGGGERGWNPRRVEITPRRWA